MFEKVKDKIKQELNQAVKEKNEVVRSTLRMLLAVVVNEEKEKSYKASKDVKLTDEEINDIISSEAKKRRDSIFEFEKGDRQDLADKEKKELEVLQKYLPEQLSEEEIKVLVEEVIKKTGASDIKDMGKVMGALMPKVKGKADGNLVSKVVKDLLQ